MNYAIGSAIVRSVAGNPIVGSIGLGLTIECIKTLASTTQNIYGLITTIKTTTSHVNIHKLLMELDFEADIIVLGSLLRSIDVEKHHTEPLSLSLKLLEEILLEIHDLLESVHKKIQYNDALWTGSKFLSYKFDSVSDKLRFIKINLDKRKQNLFDIIKINDHLLTTPYTHKIIVESDDKDFNISLLEIKEIKETKDDR